MIRRVGTIVAALVIAAIGAVVVSAPAQAADGQCEHGQGWYIDGGNNIHAYNFLECINGQIINKPVSIEREVYTGTWQTVASGLGETAYYCNGTQYTNRYRVLNSVFNDMCG